MHAKFQCSIMNTLEDMNHVYLIFFCDRQADWQADEQKDGRTDGRTSFNAPPLTFVKRKGQNLYL